MAWSSGGRRRCPAGFSAIVFVTCFNLIASAGLARAQGTASAAGVIGQVKDESGGILPGVSVTATSPTLQVPSVTTVTDAQGEYRLSPLPIGTYALEYSLAGFQTIRLENVRLTVGFTAKLDQVMSLGTVAETITVSGASPVVDVTSGATRSELTREAVDLVPTSRTGIISFLAQVPSVRQNLDVGGSSVSDTPILKVYGQISQHWQMLEGVLTSDTGTIESGSHYEFNAMEGARIQFVGNNAEMPRRGMLIDVVTKSGGNDFHGDALWSQTGNRFEATNVDAALMARGVADRAELRQRYDLSVTPGGSIVKDKVWFFASGRIRKDAQTAIGAFYPDGSPVVNDANQRFALGKATYQVTPGNRLIGFWQFTRKKTLNGASSTTDTSAMLDNHANFRIGKVEWQAVRGNAVTISVQLGEFGWFSQGLGVSNQVATSDLTTLRVTGAALRDGQHQSHWRHHAKATVATYRPDLLGGSHEFTTGFDTLYSGNATSFDSRASGNYQLLFQNGVPFEINTWNYPTSPQNLDTYVGVYAQDAWRIGPRLTLHLGARVSHEAGHIPAICRPVGDFAAAQCFPDIQSPPFNSIVPRANVAYDLFGNGKTAIKGGYGRFAWVSNVDPEILSLNPYSVTTTTWRWHDLNGDRAYAPGEVNLNPNGPDFVTFGSLTQAVPNPNVKLPVADEFLLALEHQLMPNFAVRVAGVYANNTNVFRSANVNIPYTAYSIPITRPDPGPDGVVGNADDPGTNLTYYDFPAAFAGASNARTTLINDPSANHSYKTIELAAAKRLSRGWQFSGSYSATKKHIPFGAGDTYLAYNPNVEINTTDDTWEWIGKFSGALVLPYEIVPSFNYEFRSGDAQARQVQLRGGTQIPSFVVNATPIGSLRLPSTNLVDLRAAKRFRLRGSRRLEARVDVFNVTNSNTVLARITRAGATYLFPSSTGTVIMFPRLVQFGLQFTW